MSVSGLVTFIAAYRYVRSLNSWVDACDYSMGSPKLTGVPFDDACRYIDWPLTALLLSIEILSLMISVMRNSAARLGPSDLARL